MGGCCDKAKIYAELTFDVDNWQEVAGKPSFGCISPNVYLVSRAVLFLLWAGVQIWTFIQNVIIEKVSLRAQFSQLTSMGNIVLAIYLGLNVYLIAKAQHDKSVKPGAPTPAVAKFTFFVGALFPTLPIMIASLFWIFVFPVLTSAPSIVTFLNHGGNVLVALEELFWSRRTLAPVQVYVVFSYGVYYVLFTFIFFLLGGTDDNGNPFIYEFLDWRKPQSTFTLLAIIVGAVVPVIYFVTARP